MKTYIKIFILHFTVLLLTALSMNAQIGVGTTTPEGILDLETTTQGIVFPRVALVASNVELPVVNPNGGNIVPGTTVYNTSLTTLGLNDIYPGIYSWNGVRWTPQFIMEDYQKFEQTGPCQRTTIREFYGNPNPNDADNIAGLTGQTFIPKYSGNYRIEVKTNFGGGRIDPFTTLDKISVSTMEGSFFFELFGSGVSIDPKSTVFDYEQGWLYTHSYSSHSTIESPNVDSDAVAHNASLVYYKYLVAGQDYDFTLSNCINTGHDYFINNGDSGDGQGHIGHDHPCSVEFTFLEEL